MFSPPRPVATTVCESEHTLKFTHTKDGNFSHGFRASTQKKKKVWLSLASKIESGKTAQRSLNYPHVAKNRSKRPGICFQALVCSLVLHQSV